MKLTGHKTRAVFDNYAITSTDHLRHAVRRLDGLTTGKVGGKVAPIRTDNDAREARK